MYGQYLFTQAIKNQTSRPENLTPQLIEACRKQDISQVEYLLRLGADPQALDKNNQTALGVALETGNEKLINKLFWSIESKPPHSISNEINTPELSKTDYSVPVSTEENSPYSRFSPSAQNGNEILFPTLEERQPYPSLTSSSTSDSSGSMPFISSTSCPSSVFSPDINYKNRMEKSQGKTVLTRKQTEHKKIFNKFSFYFAQDSNIKQHDVIFGELCQKAIYQDMVYTAREKLADECHYPVHIHRISADGVEKAVFSVQTLKAAQTLCDSLREDRGKVIVELKNKSEIYVVETSLEKAAQLLNIDRETLRKGTCLRRSPSTISACPATSDTTSPKPSNSDKKFFSR